MNDGYGYGPREASPADVAAAADKLEVIPAGDSRREQAVNDLYATLGNHHRSVQRGREQAWAAAAEAGEQQDALWGSPDPEAGK